jgi:signal peptidase II
VPFFLLVPAAALVICLHVLRQTPLQDRLSRLGLGLVVGGALGNAWDRLLTGEVVDFIQADLGFWPFHPWPIFNVADSCVCVGVALLLWRSFRPLPAPAPQA